MGKTKRERNIAQNIRREALLAEIKKEKRRILAYPPAGYITRTDAMRNFKLSEDDLTPINPEAVYSEKNGQGGIYYPVLDVEALELKKKEHTEIDKSMLSEAAILRQVPKSHFEPNYREGLAGLRKLGVRGSRDGHKGKSTLFYSVETVETYLKVRVVLPTEVEGVDYMRMKNVPSEIQRDVANPVLSIWAEGSYGMAEFCFFDLQVSEIQARGCLGLPVLRMSKRRAHLTDEISVSQPTINTMSDIVAEDTSEVDNRNRDTSQISSRNEDLDRENNECPVS